MADTEGLVAQVEAGEPGRGKLAAQRRDVIREVIAAQRRELLRLRRQKAVGDTVVHRVEHELDLQEAILV